MDRILLARKKITFKNQKCTKKPVGMCKKKGLTDTFWAAITPFGGASVSSVAGDLAGSFQLITLVTGKTYQGSNSKPRFRPHGACSVHHLSRIGTLLDCEDQQHTIFHFLQTLKVIKTTWHFKNVTIMLELKIKSKNRPIQTVSLKNSN